MFTAFLICAILSFLVFAIPQIIYSVLVSESLNENQPVEKVDNSSLPTVSIVIPARDEEDNIGECLEALLHLDYPTDKLQIWLADDQSSDKTAEIAQKYADKYDHYHYYLVTDKFPRVRGKQNALAKVITETSGEYVAIIDADIAVKPTWLRTILTYFHNDIRMVCGITLVKPHRIKSLNDRMQACDWLFANMMFNGLKQLGQPLSGLGNNMIFKRTAYDEIGGYQSMTYCLNEDLEIFQRMCKESVQYYNHSNHVDSVNLTSPLEGFIACLKQRYRWSKGGHKLPLFKKAVIVLPPLINYLIVFGLFIDWRISLALLVLKILTDLITVYPLSSKLQAGVKFYDYFLWTFFQIAGSFLVPFCILFHKKIKWKGRKV